MTFVRARSNGQNEWLRSHDRALPDARVDKSSLEMLFVDSTIGLCRANNQNPRRGEHSLECWYCELQYGEQKAVEMAEDAST